MKNIETIKLILKEKPDEDIYYLFSNDSAYNLIYLCTLNKKYLAIVLDQILNSKDIIGKYRPNLPYLLSNFPNLIDKISDDLLNKLNNNNWVKILSNQPLLFDKCKIIDELTENNIYDILRNQPQLIDKFKNIYKDKYANTLLYFILNSKEDLNIDFNKLFEFNLSNNINNEFDYHNWLDILTYNPNLIKICPIVDEISNLYNDYPDEVIKLVSNQPKFKHFLPSVDKILNKDLIILISNQPSLIEELKININKFYVDDWAEILEKQPQLIERCDKLDKFDIYYWTIILKKQPKLFKYCNKIDEISYIDFPYILKEEPSLIKNYNIDKISGIGWSFILEKQPKLIKYCNKLNEIPTEDMVNVLKEQPQLADKCNKFDNFNSFNWCELLMKQPQLIDKCKNINIIKRSHRIELLKMHPNLLDKVNIKNINNDCIKILYNSREHHLRLMKSYIKNNNKHKKVLTDMINIYPDLKDLYTKNNLWQYVDFNKLTDNLEYGILK